MDSETDRLYKIKIWLYVSAFAICETWPEPKFW